MAAMTVEELKTFLAREFPQSASYGVELVSVGEGRGCLRLPVEERHLRPGGTVSGPSMMALVDMGMYVTLLAVIGPAALAVTSSLEIHFLRKPKPDADILAKIELLKVGRRLAVGRATLFSEGSEAPVADATATYAIPE